MTSVTIDWLKLRDSIQAELTVNEEWLIIGDARDLAGKIVVSIRSGRSFEYGTGTMTAGFIHGLISGARAAIVSARAG